jgi:subtilase family serine protease
MGVGTLAVVGLLVACAPGAGARPQHSVPLAGTASPAAARTRDVAPVPGDAAVSSELVLNPRDPAGAQALALAASTPGTPAYRRYLTSRQWEAQFSPTRAQVDEVRSWLRSQGLRARSVSADRLAIDVAGTGAGVERAFDTTLGYHVVEGERLQLAETDLSVPSSLAGIVAGAAGVNQIPATPTDVVAERARRHRAALPATTRRIGPPPAQASAPPCGAFYGQAFDTTDPPYGGGYRSPSPYVVCGYTPVQLRQAYGLTGLVDLGDSGSGQTVAIIDAYASPTLLADAQTYARTNDPAHPLGASQFSETTAHSFNDRKACEASSWFGEQSLDVEAVHAMAPGAHIVYVGAKNCFQALYDTLRSVVDHHTAEVVNASWGDNAGDLLDDASTRAAVDDTLMMAAGTGVSVVFASGDNGDEFSATGVVAPDYPASSPWATAVGGTTLEFGFGIGEYGWSTGNSDLCTQAIVGATGCSSSTLDQWLPTSFQGGSGGGTSYHYAQPSYQAGVVPPDLATANAASVGPGPKRVEPDVSMDGDPATGMLIGLTQAYAHGTRYGQYRVGGTSLSAPLFAGVVALADQWAGSSLGFLNPALYTMARTEPVVLHAVTPGQPQSQTMVAYANSLDASDGSVISSRIVDYQGVEIYCAPSGSCSSRDVSLTTGGGYSDMTGTGAPRTGFVPALAKL